MHCMRRVLYIITAALVGSPAVSAAQRAVQTPASLSGKVVADSTEKPLANAIIGLLDVGVSTRSDSAGNFELKDIRPGKHQVSVRLLGYSAIRTTVEFKPGEKIEGDFVLTKAQALATVEVKDKAKPIDPRLQEFEEHKKGPGQFRDASTFANAGGRSLTDIVSREFAGIRLVRSGGKELLASTRGGSGSRDCYFQVILNNIPMTNVGPFDLGTILTTDVVGLEFYSVANTPMKYGGTAPSVQCGTIVVWTK